MNGHGRRPGHSSPNSSRRFVTIHGHFYQPPRENPWLETVELQSSAAPYHDWNERITSECYAPNGASRIEDHHGQIIQIVNNYSEISFNFGPTLLSWLEAKAPRTYRMILDADRASAANFSGHGSALAQVYNHIILPLASPRDAQTQIRWGIADFEHRFGRRPEGMWLSETAVNRQTLDLLAQEGIRFTVLAPNQCARVRRRSESADAHPWTETPNATVDPTHPYRVPLDAGRSIAVFFYNGPDSRAIAFEGLLNNGEEFARRLLRGFHPDPTGAQISHVATDGESYGHHHKRGEMALSSALRSLREHADVQLTNYGEFLANFPPEWEAEVVEDSSWSCAHGIERWRSDCGCNGGKPGWNQRWRRPLREALDHLRDCLVPLWEDLAAPLLKDLWAARDGYIRVLLDPSPATRESFLAEHAVGNLSPADRVRVWQLLDLQRNALLMYTSCGWFFDDISGIETVQILAYAGRVLQLAHQLFPEAAAEVESAFLDRLAQAKSNVPFQGDGAEIYRRLVSSMRVGLREVAAHYAISSIFRAYPEHGELFGFDIHRSAHEIFSSGRGRVALGHAQIGSRSTEETASFLYAVLHLGDQNLSAAVKPFDPSNSAETDAFRAFSAACRAALRRADLPEVMRLIDRSFGETAFSLTSLFRDEQERILSTVLDQTLSEMETSLREIYEDHSSLLHYLTEAGIDVPPALSLAANFAVNAQLRRALEAEIFNADELATLLARARADRVTLDTTVLSFSAAQRLKRAMIALDAASTAIEDNRSDRPDRSDRMLLRALQAALSIARAVRELPFEVNLWQAQNIWNDLVHQDRTSAWPERRRADLRRLGQALHLAPDHLAPDQLIPDHLIPDHLIPDPDQAQPC